MTVITQIEGHDITVAHDGIFRTEVDGVSYSDHTLDGLRGKLADLKQKQVKYRKLSLPVVVYDDKGGVVAGVITGVNLHTGQVTGLGKEPPTDIWVAALWIVDCLVERRGLENQIAALDARLDPFRVGRNASRLVGAYRVTAANYGQALDLLEQQYTEKLTKAKELEAERS